MDHFKHEHKLKIQEKKKKHNHLTKQYKIKHETNIECNSNKQIDGKLDELI